MQPQPLSRDEAKALLAACPNTTAGIRDRAVFATLYRGGTRISATLQIRPSDINWDRQLIAIHVDKGGKGRTITIDTEALDILRVWAERRKSLGVNGHHPFFCATNKQALGNHLDSSHFRHKIKKLCKEAGIERRCYCHLFRHTAASEMYEEGFNVATISVQLGHASISATDTYLHLMRPDLMNEKLKERTW